MCLCSSFMLVIVKCFMFLILYEFFVVVCVEQRLNLHVMNDECIGPLHLQFLTKQKHTYQNLFTHIYNELTSIIPLHTLCICLDLTVFSGFFFLSHSFYLTMCIGNVPRKKIGIFFSSFTSNMNSYKKYNFFSQYHLKERLQNRNKCSQTTIISN